MKNFKMTTLATAIVILSLTGCAATKDAASRHAQALETSSATFEQSKPVTTSAILDAEASPNGNFAHVAKNWVNPKPVVIDENVKMRASLPAFFNKNVALTMPGRVGVVEVLSELQRLIKVKINISQDIYVDGNELGKFIADSNGAVSGNTAGGAAATAGLGATNRDAINAKAVAKDTVANTSIMIDDFVFRGNLLEALDLLSAKANISWSYNNGEIAFVKYEVKTYNIAALAGTTKTTSALNTPSGSNETNNISRESTLATWTDIKPYLLSLLSSKGYMSVMESSGLITIKDSPEIQKKVAKAIKDLNAVIGKQVFLNVKVFSVTKNAGDDYGINWDIAWNQLGQLAGRGGMGFAFKNVSGSQTNSNYSVGVTNGLFANTSMVVSALSTLGKASVVNEFSITTLNGQPAPITNERVTTYLAKLDATVTDATSTAPASTKYVMTTDKVSQGVNMNITPKIDVNGKVLLEYTMALNDLEKMNTFSTGGSTPQTVNMPVTTVKNILQRASLKSGETLVLSGFKQKMSLTDDNGVGSASNVLLGGKSQANVSEQYLVITVTPYVPEDNNDE
jgi:type IVB pilus formation R64 PilN family outer membrane protein